MAIEITEDDICGYDDGELCVGGTIVYESSGTTHNKIKETRTRDTDEKAAELSDDTKSTLQRIEQELLQLDVEDRSSEEYHRIHNLYRRMSNAYNRNNNDVELPKDDCITKEKDKETMTDFTFNYHDIQRLTKLEQKLSLLEESVGFDVDQEEENSELNIISRINKLYSHLKLLKNDLEESDPSTLNTPQDLEGNVQAVKSFEKLTKYTPYMDHIITRLETYSSLYDGMIENNLQLQEWDNKIDTIIRQQDRWLELLNQIDQKLDNQ